MLKLEEKLSKVKTEDINDKQFQQLRLQLALHYRTEEKGKQIYEIPTFLEDRLKIDDRKTADKFLVSNK